MDRARKRFEHPQELMCSAFGERIGKGRRAGLVVGRRGRDPDEFARYLACEIPTFAEKGTPLPDALPGGHEYVSAEMPAPEPFGKSAAPAAISDAIGTMLISQLECPAAERLVASQFEFSVCMLKTY